jgi:hypothetical protein
MDGRIRKSFIYTWRRLRLTHVGPPEMLGLGVRWLLHGGAISVRLEILYVKSIVICHSDMSGLNI